MALFISPIPQTPQAWNGIVGTIVGGHGHAILSLGH
jgi:hypothetical protein